MRVISQDGTKDFPYDSSSVSIYGGCINGRIYVRMQLCGGCDDSVDVADYSTKEKAIKAMEMLRERHTDNIFCREDIQYKAEIMLDDGLNIVREMMMKCEYFQFPQDEDVEV